MKVIKLEGNIKVCNSDVSKQPTIQVMLGGNVKVTLDDGRVLEDNDLEWDDVPHFNNDELDEEELNEINEQIEENLIDAANRISEKISEISVGISGG